MSIDKLKNKFSTGAFVADVKHYFSKINEIIDYLNNLVIPTASNYKVYTALLTQSGIDAPVSIVLENTLIGVPVWTKFDTGTYKLTLNNAFTNNKTLIPGFSSNYDIGGVYAVLSDASTVIGYYNFYQTNENIITLEVFNNSFAATDLSTLIGVNATIPIEIRVYN